MSKTNPKVTVVTITYNLFDNKRVKTFRQCLASVHAQSYDNIEHIIIDGASSDGTVNLIKEYAKKGWVRYISEPDAGMYDAMNKGLKLAEGDYIAYLNSDDYYHNKDAIKLSVKALMESGADYSYADTRAINAETDREVGTWKGDINQLPFGTHYCHQSMLTSTAVMRELGGFNITYKVSADSDFMVKLAALNKKPVYLPCRIVSYRSGGASNMHQQQCREDHSLAFYQYIGKKSGLSRNDCYLMWNYSIFHEKGLIRSALFGLRLKKPEWMRPYYYKLLRYTLSRIKRLLIVIIYLPLRILKSIYRHLHLRKVAILLGLKKEVHEGRKYPKKR